MHVSQRSLPSRRPPRHNSIVDSIFGPTPHRSCLTLKLSLTLASTRPRFLPIIDFQSDHGKVGTACQLHASTTYRRFLQRAFPVWLGHGVRMRRHTFAALRHCGIYRCCSAADRHCGNFLLHPARPPGSPPERASTCVETSAGSRCHHLSHGVHETSPVPRYALDRGMAPVRKRSFGSHSAEPRLARLPGRRARNRHALEHHRHLARKDVGPPAPRTRTPSSYHCRRRVVLLLLEPVFPHRDPRREASCRPSPLVAERAQTGGHGRPVAAASRSVSVGKSPS
jgi:hypothetical protein